MRKPNGYGSIYKLSGNRRKPYIAVITSGYEWQLNKQPIDFNSLSEEDQMKCKCVQKRKVIGYYANKKDAEIALAEYNQNPYDLDITFAKIYNDWMKQKADTISHSSMVNYDVAFKQLSALHNRKFSELKTYDLENAIIKSGAKSSTQRMMKILMNQLYRYAIKYDIVQIDYASRFGISQEGAKIERRPFTDEEIASLWKDESVHAKAALILLYTGMRVRELKYVEYDSSLQAFKGGLKTDSGRDRVIPVRNKIMPLIGIVGSLKEDSDANYYEKMKRCLKKYNHKTHDCRVTFATRYKDADPIAVKLILGHKIKDITKSVYTKYTPAELLAVVESVEY